MERIGAVQACVDKIVAAQTKEIDIKFGYVHLYSVSQTCALLAMKRQQNVEGNRKDHAHQGAAAARKILQELNLFSEEEIDMISNAIWHHSDKDTVDTPFDEVLKDADALQHFLIMPLVAPAPHEAARVSKLKEELGIQ